MEENSLEMKIPFTALSYSLQSSIFTKLNYRQFSQFEECCQFSYNMAEKRPSIKFPFRSESVKFYENHPEFEFEKYVLPIEQCSRIIISTHLFRIMVDFSQNQFDFVMKHFRSSYIIAFYGTINLSSHLFVSLVKGLKLHCVRWWCNGDYLGFAELDCTLVLKGRNFTANELWDMQPELLAADMPDLPTVDIIGKLRDDAIVGSSNLLRTRIFAGPHTVESIEEAVLIFGDNCQLAPDDVKESLKINCKAWMITRNSETKPFALILLNENKLEIGPFP